MMKRLNKFIEKVGIDKVLHFAVGGWVVSAVSPFGLGAMLIAWAVIVGLNIIKEAFLDDFFDWKDVAACVMGGMMSFLMYVPADIFA